MRACRFQRYELRTTEPEAATAFYAEALGMALPGPALTVSPLPERAAAAGAPAHWLGHLGVDRVDEAAARMVASGGQRLGGVAAPDGEPPARVVVRDPFGAVVALIPRGQALERDPVAWRLLLVRRDHDAFVHYAEGFGWGGGEVVRAAPEGGRYRPFTWEGAGRSAGAVADGARLPHIHAQWMFFFAVPDLDRARAAVQAEGGLALEATPTLEGGRGAACEDPQGAAFGLLEPARGGA